MNEGTTPLAPAFSKVNPLVGVYSHWDAITRSINSDIPDLKLALPGVYSEVTSAIGEPR